MLVTILVFLVILSVLVLVHELGHFFVAKFFKIKVEEFGFGLPPRAFGIKRGETLYSVNWLPIGGFVKLYGEDEAGGGRVKRDKQSATSNQQSVKKDEDRMYSSKPIWQRALVIVAGVFMNFVLAVVLLSFLFSAVGVPSPTDRVQVSQVLEGAPAAEAGLKSGDIVEEINGRPITTTEELIAITRESLGEPVTLTVIDNGLSKVVEVTPRVEYPEGQGPMGVAVSQEVINKKYPIYEAPFVGTKEALKTSWLIVSGLGALIANLALQGEVPSDVAGPLGIAQLTGIVVDAGLFVVLSFIALLSLNLAIINILPIPALDGGRLLFIIIEAVTRKKVSPRVETIAHTAGMVFLLGLIALITLHDVIRLISGTPIIPDVR